MSITLMKNLSVATCGAVLVALGTAGMSQAATLVVPNELTNTEGSSFAVRPFGLASSSVRYQEVYDASEFTTLGLQSITQIAFRPDGPTGNAFSSTIANVQIDLSTTIAPVDGLSTTFASNVGTDNTIVYSGSLSLSSSNSGPAAGPNAFDIIITFATPFLYNPAAGNLLLDVRNFSGGSTTAFDSEAVLGDSISRVTTDNVNALIGSTSTGGLVTQFTTTPVPFEFSPTLGLGLLGALWGAGSLLKRKRIKVLDKSLN